MIRNLQSLSLRQPSAMGWVLLGLCVPITLSANAGTPFDVGRYLTPNPGESDDRPSGRGPFNLLVRA